MIALVSDWLGAGRAGPTLEPALPPGTQVILAGRPAGRAAGAVWGLGGCVAREVEADTLVCFDGRLDDAEGLRRELGRTPSANAAELVLHAYRRHGRECVRLLRGDFAFALWDGRSGSLIAARDPFGVRSLHHATRDGLTFVATDVDVMLEAGVVRPIPDDTMIVEFLLRDVRSPTRTFFADAARVPAGHVVTFTAGGAEAREYRQPPDRALSFSGKEECHEALRERLTIAVKRRLVPGGTALIELSGGVDSTSIVCLADQLIRSAGEQGFAAIAAAGLHPGLACDETEFVRSVSEAVKLPVFSWDATRVDERDLSEPLVAAPGNRIAMAGGTEGSVEIAKAHDARVILNGTGGDQLGFPQGVTLDRIVAGRWREAARDVFRPDVGLERSLRATAWLALSLSPPWVRRARERVRRPPALPPWLTARGFDSTEGGQPPAGRDVRFFSHAARLRWEFLTTPSLAFSLDHKQRHARFHGLEQRFPFLDWDLVQFVTAIPFQFWPEPRVYERLHRDALRSILPAEVYRRRSKAFFTPAMAHRVRAQLDLVHDLLDGPGPWESERYVSRAGARRLLASFLASPEPDFPSVHSVWAIAALEAWLRRILRYAPARRP